MHEPRRLSSPGPALTATVAILVSAACATNTNSRGPADMAAPVTPDTVSFVASRDSFFVVILADTTRLFRVRDGDTSYVSEAHATGLARSADPANGEPQPTGDRPADEAPASGMIAIAIPDNWDADSAGAAGDAVAPAPRPARDSSREYYQYEEDPLPVPPASDTVAFERLVARELAGFNTALTPETWRARYPADSLARFLRGSGETWRWRHRAHEGEPCARALRRIPLPDGEPALRVALFYPPPAEEGLPAVRDTLGLDIERCRLGALWLLSKIEAPPPARTTAADSARVRSRLDAIEAELRARLGPPRQVGPPFLPSYIDGSWNRFWRENGTSHLLTYRGHRRDVEVGKWTEIAGIPIEPATPERVLERFDIAQLRRLAAGAALDTTLADSVLSLASRTHLIREGFAEVEPGLDAALAATLTSWMTATDALPPLRRAAALLVADLALELGLLWMDSSERETAAPFEALGAEYGHTLGSSYVYRHNWLHDAFAVSVEGPVHDRAFLALLRRAFVTLGCTHDESGFRTVIERGERFLAGRPDSPLAPEVALEIARAYGDVVAIAWEIDEVVAAYMDGEPFEAEAPGARRSALEFYRMALEGLEDASLRGQAWREAWRLAAGMPPVEAVHVSICD